MLNSARLARSLHCLDYNHVPLFPRSIDCFIRFLFACLFLHNGDKWSSGMVTLELSFMRKPIWAVRSSLISVSPLEEN